MAGSNTHNEPSNKASMIGATMILATFSTTSSNIMYPFVYATLGLALGPICGFLLQGFMCLVSVRVMDVAIRANAKNFGELGLALGGERGRLLLNFVQLLNNALFMPVALVISAGAVQEIALAVCDPSDGPVPSACSLWQCNVYPLIFTVALAWPLLLVAREIGHLQWMAALSIVAIFVQTILLLVFVSSHAPEASVAGDAAPSPPARLFGKPGASWDAYVAAGGVFLYSYCPMFVGVEVMASMRQREHAKYALVLAYLLPAGLVYLPTGLAGAIAWGADVADPVTSGMPPGPMTAIVNGILLYSTLLDFVIAATTVNAAVQRRFFPSVDRTLALRTLPHWLTITLPALACALLLGCFVPQLDSLVGLLTMFCVPGAMLVFPSALLLLRQHRTGTQPNEQLLDSAWGIEPVGIVPDESGGRRSGSATALFASACLVGLTLFLAISAQTVASIVEMEYNGSYWCDDVG
jgi:hypothetical protein